MDSYLLGVHSLLENLAAGPQFLCGVEPVFLRRPVPTASTLPQRIGQRRDILVPKDRNAVFIHGSPMHLPSLLKSLLGVFQSLPGELLPGLMILLLMGIRRTTMSVGGIVVQFCGTLMIFVMRSLAIACRH